MKKLKYTKKINKEAQTFIQMIDNLCNKLNKEYARNMNKLLQNIAKGENLDINMLKEKYLKTLDISSSEEDKEEINDTIHIILSDTSNEIDNDIDNEIDNNSLEDIIFDKIVINGNNYYYENKENGKIYDAKSNIVGCYNNNKFNLI